MVLNTPLSHKLSIYYYNTDVCKDPNDYLLVLNGFISSYFSHDIGPGLAPDWLSGFKVFHYCYVGQKPPDVQCRNREKRCDKEHHEKVSFFSSS